MTLSLKYCIAAQIPIKVLYWVVSGLVKWEIEKRNGPIDENHCCFLSIYGSPFSCFSPCLLSSHMKTVSVNSAVGLHWVMGGSFNWLNCIHMLIVVVCVFVHNCVQSQMLRSDALWTPEEQFPQGGASQLLQFPFWMRIGDPVQIQTCSLRYTTFQEINGCKSKTAFKLAVCCFA